MRVNVVKTLGKIGKDAVPALVSALQDKDANVRINIANALGAIGTNVENTKELVDVLTKILKDKNENVWTRSYAIETLKKIDSPEARFVLIRYQILVKFITRTIETLTGTRTTSDVIFVKKAALSLANKNQLKACENKLANLLIGWKCPKK